MMNILINCMNKSYISINMKVNNYNVQTLYHILVNISNKLHADKKSNKLHI